MIAFQDRIRGDVFAPVRFYTPPSHPLIYSKGWPLFFLLCAAELRTFIKFLTKMLLSFCSSVRWDLPCSHSPHARLCRVPSSVIRGRLNLPMSLNPSPLILYHTFGNSDSHFHDEQERTKREILK